MTDPSRARPTGPGGPHPLRPGAVLRAGVAGAALLGAWSVVVLLTAVAPGGPDRVASPTGAATALLALGAAAAYLLAGGLAARAEPTAPLSNAIVAAMTALVLWLPVRALVWLVRGEDRGLFTGPRPALALVAIVSQLLVAAGLGLLAGLFVSRRRSPAR